MSISTSAQFERKKLDHTKDNLGHLMISIKAEDKDFDRTPVSIVLVLDLSGSMGGKIGKHQQKSDGMYFGDAPIGQRKIDALKETSRKLIEHISGQDEVAIISFSDVAEVLSDMRSKSARRSC